MQAGWRILADELDRQVLPDGVYYEQSTYYQRYVLDIYVHAILLAERARIAVPDSMLERVQQLAGMLEAVMDPIGACRSSAMTTAGDSCRSPARRAATSGRPWPRRHESAPVMKPVLVPPRRRSRPCGWPAARQQRPYRPRAPVASRVFPAGGVVVLRHGAGSDANIMVLDAGRHGPTRTNGVHSHADALAFDLVVLGRRMLIDPGTFTYVVDPEERDRFRSTAMHNTVTVGDGSSSVADGPFGWAVMRHARVESWAHGAGFDYASTSLLGYGASGPHVVHRREVLFLHALGWFVRDRVSGCPEGLPVRLHFHAAPAWPSAPGHPVPPRSVRPTPRCCSWPLPARP